MLEDDTKDGDLCSAFVVRASASYEKLSSTANVVTDRRFCIDIEGDQFADVYGDLIPQTEICIPLQLESLSLAKPSFSDVCIEREGYSCMEQR